MVISQIKEMLRGASIQKKLIIINLSVTTVALLFAVIMAVVGEYITKRNFIMESLQVQAQMVASNTTAAIIFNDKKDAEETLLAFAASSDVYTAIIYDEAGEIFARYVKNKPVVSEGHATAFSVKDDKGGIKDAARKALLDDSVIQNNKIHISQRINFENKTITIKNNIGK